jgi:hypothetical protein
MCWPAAAAGRGRGATAASEETKMDFLLEIWEFYRVRKKLWMLPLMVLFLAVGFLVVLTEGSAVAPFIYTIF